MSLLLVILLVVIFVKIADIKTRLTILENEKSLKREAEMSAPVSMTAQIPNVLNQVPVGVNSVLPPQDTADSMSAGDRFIIWFKEDWLLKLGGLLLLIGLGWFTTYAFINNWIGEMGRITLGLFVGVLVIALGSWRIKKYINQGGIFLVVGSAIILLTVFAAREVYDMFTPFFALAVMFLSTAYISLVSVKFNSLAVSMSGLVMAFVAPLLVNNSGADKVWIFSYLFVVTLGAIWIVAIKKNWGVLIFTGLVGVLLYSLPVASIYNYNNKDVLIWFAYAFAAVYFLASIINIINSKENDIKAFLWTAVGNGAFLLMWIMSAVTKEWQSSIIALWMVIFAIGAFISFGVTKIRSVFYVYAGVAIAMLIVATTIELDGYALLVAYTLESFLIPLLIYFATKDVRASTVSSILVAGPLLMSLSNLETYYRSHVALSKDFFVIALVILVLMILGIIYKKVKEANVNYNFYPDNFLLIVGSVYAYILLWSFLRVGIGLAVISTTLSLVIFTIVGLVKYFYGMSIGSKILRNYGGVLIGFVILRLLFVDIWEMATGAKVFVFILIGVLLMSTAFVSKRIRFGQLEKVNN